MAGKKIGERTVTVLRAPKVDRLSDTASTVPAEHDVEGCVVTPRSSYEAGKGWVIVSGRMIVAPFGSDVLATDLVRVDGRVWEVDGEPGEYETKKGKPKAMIFYLKRQGT
jgi:hypothetical protein